MAMTANAVQGNSRFANGCPTDAPGVNVPGAIVVVFAIRWSEAPLCALSLG